MGFWVPAEPQRKRTRPLVETTYHVRLFFVATTFKIAWAPVTHCVQASAIHHPDKWTPNPRSNHRFRPNTEDEGQF
jgi:hypothetical protein